ncbi:MAG: hypothetical protein AVDCRST_MAG34-1576 [uncultured Nocardioidaceae bacterium]|uniref:Uncharacterized protein n=1 Tax=uncultured Nocardioidaceae bacterium TaxID=253824 RepID=A0A6J4L6E2_9ACTN|nr:MAG: hypothetical protein AVDCRST_MAG34-1576 [uncultured Nocardioidaceae bacterium]
MGAVGPHELGQGSKQPAHLRVSAREPHASRPLLTRSPGRTPSVLSPIQDTSPPEVGREGATGQKPRHRTTRLDGLFRPI